MITCDAICLTRADVQLILGEFIIFGVFLLHEFIRDWIEIGRCRKQNAIMEKHIKAQWASAWRGDDNA
jgi:hypothetical protein